MCPGGAGDGLVGFEPFLRMVINASLFTKNELLKCVWCLRPPTSSSAASSLSTPFAPLSTPPPPHTHISQCPCLVAHMVTRCSVRVRPVAFDLFDADASGYLDLQEFETMAALLNGG
jgi:hypothetical protein